MTGCAAYGCSNSCQKGYYMAAFPKEPKRRAMWITAVNRPQLVTKKAYLCDKHFDEASWEKIRVDGKRKLKSTAVPTKFLPTKGTKEREKTANYTATAIQIDFENQDYILEIDLTKIKQDNLMNLEHVSDNTPGGKTVLSKNMIVKCNNIPSESATTVSSGPGRSASCDISNENISDDENDMQISNEDGCHEQCVKVIGKLQKRVNHYRENTKS